MRGRWSAAASEGGKVERSEGVEDRDLQQGVESGFVDRQVEPWREREVERRSSTHLVRSVGVDALVQRERLLVAVERRVGRRVPLADERAVETRNELLEVRLALAASGPRELRVSAASSGRLLDSMREGERDSRSADRRRKAVVARELRTRRASERAGPG